MILSQATLYCKYSCLSSLPKVGTYKREVCIGGGGPPPPPLPKFGTNNSEVCIPPPPPPHPPPNIPYSWHIISIGPESCHQELWLVDIIPYYRRAPSKNIPSKRKWSRGQGLFCVGPFNIVLSFTCCLRMTRRKQKGYKNQLYNMLNFISLGRIFLRNADDKVALKLPIILQ